jgi:trehalose 6-phosphate phosphatase
MADPLQPPPPGLAEGAALFLDFDGTLVELAESPEAIAVPEGLPALLERLSARLDGRVALISGRSIADLERHLPLSQIAVSGSHGLELRLGGAAPAGPPPPPGLSEARDALHAFAAGQEGLLVEEKPASVALHFRQAAGREAEAAALCSDVAERTGLSVQPGKMVIELRPPGADKGDALRQIMTEPEFAGARPLFVGDDWTDEHAFAAAAELGGGGILVGAARATAAHWRLDDVAAVAAWLESVARG